MGRYLRIGLTLALTGCTNSINIDTPAPDGLAERFEAVAFYDEFSDRERPLYRWAGPIRIAVDGDYRNAVNSLAKEISDLTGLSVRLVQRADQNPNLTIVIEEWARLDALIVQTGSFFGDVAALRRFTCAATFHESQVNLGTGRIDAAFVFIDEGLGPTEIRRCLTQEITQTLGLPNDIDDPDGTVFSSYSRRETLSESDRRMVRILYDPRLTPGMTRGEAMPIVREIVAEFSLLNGQTSE